MINFNYRRAKKGCVTNEWINNGETYKCDSPDVFFFILPLYHAQKLLQTAANDGLGASNPSLAAV